MVHIVEWTLFLVALRARRGYSNVKAKNTWSELEMFAGNMFCFIEISARVECLDAVGTCSSRYISECEYALEFEETSNAKIVNTSEDECGITIGKEGLHMQCKIDPLPAAELGRGNRDAGVEFSDLQLLDSV